MPDSIFNIRYLDGKVKLGFNNYKEVYDMFEKYSIAEIAIIKGNKDMIEYIIPLFKE